jgi:glyoxylate/hydroxypyruvate reductase A
MARALLFSSPEDDPVAWSRALRALMPGLEIRVSPNLGDPADIEVALVWKPPEGELARLPNLRLVASLAVGVDQLLAERGLDPHIPIVRLGEAGMAEMMNLYVAHAVLRHHRDIPAFERAQRQRRWEYRPPRRAQDCRVGVMGLGMLGRAVARFLAGLGFSVAGWSRSRKRIPGAVCFHGRDGLDLFLARSDILVVLLPLTAETRGLLNRDLFSRLPQGAKLVSCGRGATIVEADLIEALRSGRIAEATLDVFASEPLPADHPFWGMEQVLITPHVAAYAVPEIAVLLEKLAVFAEEVAARTVAENIRRLEAGEPLLYRVDRDRGY